MTTVATIPSRAYSVGQSNSPVTVSAALTDFTLTFSCVGWPAGGVVDAAITWSNGRGAGLDLNGGQLDKHGVPLTSLSFTISKPAGITQGTVKATVIQAITTAITVTAV